VSGDPGKFTNWKALEAWGIPPVFLVQMMLALHPILVNNS
jgi:hypothetical protein